MAEARSVAVLGLGLMGGSLARDLSSRGLVVKGWDFDPRTLEQASRERVVQPLGGDLKGLEEADLVILAVPVRATLELLPQLAGLVSAEAVVTDVGSTKRSASSAAVRAGLSRRFVGSHPLAGDHRSGWGASRVGLFDGERIFITVTEHTEEDAIEVVCGMWRTLGARPKRIGASEHDRLMAWVSHAPQALSSVLALALEDAGLGRADLGPGGRAMTRLAAGSSTMWADIFADNSEEVTLALQSVVSRLGSLTAAVERADVAELQRLLQSSRRWATDYD